MPKSANRTRSIRQAHWIATAAVLACAFAAALLLYAVAPDADQRELRAQGGDVSRTVIPRPPVETPDDADRTAPSPNDGRRTIVAPPYPDYPTGSITGVGSVALDWDDVPTALSYAVQVHTGTAWTLLPVNDVTIQFSGTSAQIDNLPNFNTYYLRLRAENSAGNSPWSGFVIIANDTSNQATSTPTSTATPTPVPNATATPTATATATPNPNSCYLLRSIAASPTPTPTTVGGPVTRDTEQSAGDTPCSYPKLLGYLERPACEARALMLANGVGSNGISVPEQTFAIDVLIVEGRSSANVVEFLEAVGADVSDYGDLVSAEDVPVSLLGPLSELPDVEAVFEQPVGQPDGRNERSVNPSSDDLESQGKVTQTLTDAPLWHEAVWVNSAGDRAGHQNVFHADVSNAPNEYSSQWDNNWLRLHDGSFFVPVEREQSDRNVRFRLRWGDEDPRYDRELGRKSVSSMRLYPFN